MKLYKFIIAAAITGMAALSTGCSDWLDYTPKDKQSYDQQFSTPAGFHSTVNGIYNTIAGSSLYGRSLSYGTIDILGLCYNISTQNTNVYEICSANFGSDYANSEFTSIWTQAYNAILNINLVLKALDEFPDVLTADDAKLIKAEMLALRAYLHFDLTRLYGPCYSREPEGLAVPFADTEEVIKRDRLTAKDILTNKIIPDLAEAQQMLSEVDPVINYGVLNSDGGGTSNNWWRYRQLRMNYYAVTLLKARVHMWMGDDDNALAEAIKITDDSKAQTTFPWVEPSKLLANNINPDRMFSTECLFGFYKNNIETIFQNYFSGTIDPMYIMQPRNGYVGTLFSSTGDYRRQSQWVTSAAAGGADYDFTKYKSFTANKDNPEFWASFYGLMRKTEAYYIAAEVWLNKGDKTKCGEYLNQVLVSRGLDQVGTRFTTEAVLRKHILMEYLREMRGEGQIYFLHKRNWQSFGSNSGGTPDFDASGISTGNDTPALTVRYAVPIPSAEKF